MYKMLAWWSVITLSLFGLCTAAEWWFWFGRDGDPVDGSVRVDEVELKGTETDQKDALIDVIKGVVNRTLWILWLIALIILLRGGFQVLTAWDDEGKSETWYKYLKTSATALIYIGVARFIVSILFYVLGLITT